jgi:hypothetical protein
MQCTVAKSQDDRWSRPIIKTPATADARSKKGQPYRPLQTKFERGGFAYRQIARRGNAAIYEQSFVHDPDRAVSYEAIRVRSRDGFYIHGRFVEPAEVYPSSDAWGVDGFTLPDRERAFIKMRLLAK